MAETEIQQIKKEYISDRIKESIDLFGSQPERLGGILMSASAVLAMLISKVLQKAREVGVCFSLAIIKGLLRIIYFIIEDLSKHYLQKKFHTTL